MQEEADNNTDDAERNGQHDQDRITDTVKLDGQNGKDAEQGKNKAEDQTAYGFLGFLFLAAEVDVEALAVFS